MGTTKLANQELYGVHAKEEIAISFVASSSKMGVSSKLANQQLYRVHAKEGIAECIWVPFDPTHKDDSYNYADTTIFVKSSVQKVGDILLTSFGSEEVMKVRYEKGTFKIKKIDGELGEVVVKIRVHKKDETTCAVEFTKRRGDFKAFYEVYERQVEMLK